MAYKRTWEEVGLVLAARKARFHKWSSKRDAIYYSPTTGRYIKAARHPSGGYEVTEHSTCPCG
jgi:hypothetical protein